MVTHQVKKVLKGVDLLTKNPRRVIGQVKNGPGAKKIPKRKLKHLASVFKQMRKRKLRLVNRQKRSAAARLQAIAA